MKHQLTISRSALIAAVSMMTFLSGCATGLDMSSLSFRNRSHDDELASTDDIKGPLERILPIGAEGSSRGSRGGYAFSERNPEYQRAMKLHDEGEFSKAESAFKKLAKANKDNALHEDSMFMLAECQFQQKRYPQAQDSYDELLNAYPSTRHTTQATQRLFQIGRYWLDFEEIVTPNEIQQVDFEQPGKQHALSTTEETAQKKSQRPLSQRYALVPNLGDRSRPYFDTEGRAIEALRSVWLKDPTGPLADDALMMTGSYYLRQGDYVEADRFFTLIRDEYPDSPHFRNAYVFGSHAKLVSYQGPEYDGQQLLAARDLKESTLRIFNDFPERNMVKEELRMIYEEEAHKEWERALFWEKKRNSKAVQIQCREILRRYPTSEAADKARQKLAELGEVVQSPKQEFSLPSIPKPSIPRPFSQDRIEEAKPIEKESTSPFGPSEPQWEASPNSESETKSGGSWLPWKWRQEPKALPEENQNSEKLVPNFESAPESEEDEFIRQLL
ncbi:MAG: tetratricopeptide repeat protein [Planctomycetaceae bacterium]|nr:tetratricopeptide repeat protein [Planctomycetaceae bacterium]